jgi:hypothetical protein
LKFDAGAYDKFLPIYMHVYQYGGDSQAKHQIELGCDKGATWIIELMHCFPAYYHKPYKGPSGHQRTFTTY